MNDTRVALLIGCSKYEDSTFQQLSAPVQDVDELTRVLADPAIGEFTVDTLINKPSGVAREQIEQFFADRRPDDLLLLYFSCHGVLDSGRRLYFVAADTKMRRLAATGISARWVKEQMDQSRSQRIVLLLDCCYSGAFPKGLRRRSADAEEILEQLGGRGRVIITASDTMEYAYGSEFTNAVVQGLQTGAADLDGDGRISVHELYLYVFDKVCQNTRNQTPTMSANGMRGRLYLAKNLMAPLPLPIELEQALRSETAWKRLWAVDGLQRLLTGGGSGGQKRTARQALLDLHDNDAYLDVRTAAGEALHRASRETGDTKPKSDHRQIRVQPLIAVGLVLVAILFTTLVASSVTTQSLPSEECSPSVKGADRVLKLGTLLPETGEFVYTGPALKAGVALAWKDIQAAGSDLRLNMELEENRDEGNPSVDTATAAKSIDQLLDIQVDAVIGPATSQVASEVIEKVICAGVIMFAPSNTSPLFTTYLDHGFYFRTAPLAILEGAVLGKLVVDDGNRTAVVVSRNDQFGRDLGEETTKAIGNHGVRVLDSFSYDPDAPRDADIQRIKDRNPDAIVLIGFGESDEILRNMIKEGLGPGNKRVYGAGATMSNTLARLVDPENKSVLAGMQGTPLYAGDEAFVTRLRDANPGLQDLTYAAQAYDAVVITVLAAADAGTDAPADIAMKVNEVTKTGEKCTSFDACLALLNGGKDIDYDGHSGSPEAPLEFTDPGEPRSGIYMISEIQADGTVKAIRSVPRS